MVQQRRNSVYRTRDTPSVSDDDDDDDDDDQKETLEIISRRTSFPLREQIYENTHASVD